MKVGIACGGTGGHIFPGLAVARVLSDKHHEVVLWLTGRDVESVSTANWKGRVITTGGKGMPAGMSLRSLGALVGLMAAFLRCWLVMMKDRPDVLLAMGGYASVGPVLAARMLGVPVVLHESNAVPGRAVEFLSRYATVVAISFQSAANYIQRCRTVLTGFPVRNEIKDRPSDRLLATNFFTVLVMGGSQGAHRLNEIAVSALCRLHQQGIPVQVIHLTGIKDESYVRKSYQDTGVPCVVFSFLKEMSMAYNQADMLIARAGAATCAEIAARAVPGILVPLPSAMRDHQTANAIAFRKVSGIDVIMEKDLSVENLGDYMRDCYRNPEKLDRMRDVLRKIPANNSAEKIAELLEKIVVRRYTGK